MTICLNMIVKNEARVIKRCFDSLHHLIDYWVIVDTGSTDGTQEIIRDYFREKNIPGELHERPWIDFATDRNFALELARGKADYLLFIDADEILYLNPGFTRPVLDKDWYYICAFNGGSSFLRGFMVKSGFAGKWVGVVHEVIVSTAAPHPPAEFKNAFLVCYPDGGRSSSPKKFHNDALMLKKAFQEDPTNSRYLFYLAQSYLANKQYKTALGCFKKRLTMENRSPEAFLTQINIARVYLTQQKPTQKIVKAYEKALDISPTRMEPYYGIANLLRKKKDYSKAYEYAKKGLEQPLNQAGITLDTWIYQWGMQLEFLLAAYALGKNEEGRNAVATILKRKDLTQNARNLVERIHRALERGDLSVVDTVT